MTNPMVLLDVVNKKISLLQLKIEFVLIQKRGHFYVEYPQIILFTVPELCKIHRHFSTVTRKKASRLLCRADSESSNGYELPKLRGFTANAMFFWGVQTLLGASVFHNQFQIASSMNLFASI